jgi:hypothetical protein
MNRGILAVAGAVVLAAAIGLYFMLRTTEPSGDPVRTDPPVDPARSADSGHGKPRKIYDAPAVVRGSGSASAPIGETRIRDHRSPDRIADDTAPRAPRPSEEPEGRKIAPQVTGGLGQQLRPLLRQCTASLAPGARTDKSRVQGEITVSIKDQQATITGARFELRDIAEASQADFKRCLTERAVGLAAPATGEADVEGYAITVSLVLP